MLRSSIPPQAKHLLDWMHSHCCPAEYLTQILARMSIPGWEPRRCLIAQPPWNVYGHVLWFANVCCDPISLFAVGGGAGRRGSVWGGRVICLMFSWWAGEGGERVHHDDGIQGNLRGSVWGPRRAELSTRAHAYYVWGLGLASQDYTPKDKGPVLTLIQISALVAQFYYGTVFRDRELFSFFLRLISFLRGNLSHPRG